jgi:hypothetical protein
MTYKKTFTSLKALTVVGTAGLLASCSASFKARSADEYRGDTRSLLSDNSARFEDCYGKAREADPNAAGTVGVTFQVAEESGKIESAEPLPDSTAPEALQRCVVDAMKELSLTPADERRAQGKLWFEFKAS